MCRDRRLCKTTDTVDIKIKPTQFHYQIRISEFEKSAILHTPLFIIRNQALKGDVGFTLFLMSFEFVCVLCKCGLNPFSFQHTKNVKI